MNNGSHQQKSASSKQGDGLRRQSAEAGLTSEHKSTSSIGADRAGRKIRLKLRFNDGRVKAVNYSDIISMDYDPDKGIILEMPPFYVIRIQGTCLAPLLDALASERISSLRVKDGFVAAVNGDKNPIVTEIIVEKWKE